MSEVSVSTKREIISIPLRLSMMLPVMIDWAAAQAAQFHGGAVIDKVGPADLVLLKDGLQQLPFHQTESIAPNECMDQVVLEGKAGNRDVSFLLKGHHRHTQSLVQLQGNRYFTMNGKLVNCRIPGFVRGLDDYAVVSLLERFNMSEKNHAAGPPQGRHMINRQFYDIVIPCNLSPKINFLQIHILPVDPPRNTYFRGPIDLGTEKPGHPLIGIRMGKQHRAGAHASAGAYGYEGSGFVSQRIPGDNFDSMIVGEDGFVKKNVPPFFNGNGNTVDRQIGNPRIVKQGSLDNQAGVGTPVVLNKRFQGNQWSLAVDMHDQSALRRSPSQVFGQHDDPVAALGQSQRLFEPDLFFRAF